MVDIYNTAFQHALLQYLKANPAGGSLHIVLSDGNLEDEHVDFCAVYAAEHHDYIGAGLAVAIRQLSMEDRVALYNRL